jgi:hypothetical protein
MAANSAQELLHLQTERLALDRRPLISQKCQSKLGQKIYSSVTMDMFKMTCFKWLRGFFDSCAKWVFFDKFFSKKN